jgi:catechol 2,3-dioxygenase-like lactoylglutathione lyase family enzyme
MVNLSHVAVGSNDLTKAKTFYDSLFGAFGITPIYEHPSGGRVYGK